MKIILSYHPIRDFFLVFDKKSYRFILYYKIFYALIIYNIASSVISVGDTGYYLSGEANGGYSGSSGFMLALGGILGKANYNTVNLFCAIISSIFIVKALKKLKFEYSFWFVYILLLIPSFELYSSIFSKEFFDCIASCLCACSIINLIMNNKYDWSILVWGAIFLFFKLQYLIAIFHVYLIIVLYRYLFKRHLLIFNLACLIIAIIDIALLIHFSDLINTYFFNFDRFFAIGNTTRKVTGDFFDNLWPGIFLAFFGLSISEVFGKFAGIVNLYSVLESTIIVSFFLFCFFFSFLKLSVTHKYTGYYFFALFFLTSWLLLVHYPFGYFNPGSGIRYRYNFYLILVFVFAKLFDLYMYTPKKAITLENNFVN